MAGTDKGIYKQSEYEYAIFIGLYISGYLVSEVVYILEVIHVFDVWLIKIISHSFGN